MRSGARGGAALLAGSALLLLLSALLALRLGAVDLSWAELWRILARGDAGEGQVGKERILLGLRLPRVLLGIGVGASLASAGAVFQAILRNPLADPYLLGLSGGAALGAVTVLVTGAAAVHPLLLPAAAFAGALGAVLVVLRLAGGERASTPTSMILSGVVVSAFCSSLVMFLHALSPAGRVHGSLFWMMGSLASPARGLLPLTLAGAAGALLFFTIGGARLNVLSLGDASALQLGVEAGRARTYFLLAASLATGLAVAASGLIGFVGLVVPHALRHLGGADHRILVPASALAGAALLVLADAGARTLAAPAEVPVGVITALVGAPFFLLLLQRKRGWMG